MFDNPFYEVGSLAGCQEELSVAALHAVVASVGGSIAPSPHTVDVMGLDATCCFQGSFTDSGDELETRVLYVQLKSSRAAVAVQRDGEEYWRVSLATDALRKYRSWGNRFLLVFFVLPPGDEQERWVVVDEDSVVMRRSLYWTSLKDVEIDRSKKTNFVYIPKRSLLTPRALVSILSSF